MKRSQSKRPTKAELEAAKTQRLPDVVGDDLSILFCGINPSLYSAAVGHHFARPGNRFWPALAGAELTPELWSPSQDVHLPRLGMGLTNLVPRPTARADELDEQEFARGRARLRRLVNRIRPKCLTVLGIGAYQTAFAARHAQLGRQDDGIGDSLIWVLPNPSGLNAHYQLPDFIRLFIELKLAVIEG